MMSGSSRCWDHDYDERVRRRRAELELFGMAHNSASDMANLAELRAMLWEHPDAVVRMNCFNRTEVDYIEALLTPDERARVVFSWLNFGTPKEQQP